MKIAVLSDIHANIHALEAVWQDIDHKQPDAVYCLGDLVGYGAFPNQVVDFIRNKRVPTLMGNYDQGVGFDREDCGCAYRRVEDERLGQQSLFWSRENTSRENKRFLQTLPLHLRLTFEDRQVLMVHGSPRRINEYLYEDRPQKSFQRLAQLSVCDLLFFGHTHLPYMKEVAGTRFINTGSVGKPKDGDARAGYVLVELGTSVQIHFCRVPYDVRAAAAAIRNSALPDRFAEMLESGCGK